jgi:hypothetical protein
MRKARAPALVRPVTSFGFMLDAVVQVEEIWLYRQKKFGRVQEIPYVILVVHLRTPYGTFSRQWKHVTQLLLHCNCNALTRTQEAFAICSKCKALATFAAGSLAKREPFSPTQRTGLVTDATKCAAYSSQCVGLVAPICVFACSPEAKWTL